EQRRLRVQAADDAEGRPPGLPSAGGAAHLFRGVVRVSEHAREQKGTVRGLAGPARRPHEEHVARPTVHAGTTLPAATARRRRRGAARAVPRGDRRVPWKVGRRRGPLTNKLPSGSDDRWSPWFLATTGSATRSTI